MGGDVAAYLASLDTAALGAALWLLAIRAANDLYSGTAGNINYIYQLKRLTSPLRPPFMPSPLAVNFHSPLWR